MVVCNDCGKDYSRLSTHWTTSTCSRPLLTGEQRELTKALILTGASILSQSSPCLQVISSRREFIEWVRDQYGIYGADKQITKSQRDGVARDQYSFKTRTSPEFGAFGNDFDLSPRIVRVWFARSGTTTYQKDPDRTTYLLEIRTSYTTLDEKMWAKRFRRYDGRAWQSYDNRVALRRKADILGFLDDHEPIPGYDWKWEFRNKPD